MGVFGDLGKGLGNGFKSIGSLPGKAIATTQILVIGVVVVIGAVLIMGAWSISSGRTNIRDVSGAVREIATAV